MAGAILSVLLPASYPLSPPLGPPMCAGERPHHAAHPGRPSGRPRQRPARGLARGVCACLMVGGSMRRGIDPQAAAGLKQIPGVGCTAVPTVQVTRKWFRCSHLPPPPAASCTHACMHVVATPAPSSLLSGRVRAAVYRGRQAGEQPQGQGAAGCGLPPAGAPVQRQQGGQAGQGRGSAGAAWAGWAGGQEPAGAAMLCFRPASHWQVTCTTPYPTPFSPTPPTPRSCTPPASGLWSRTCWSCGRSTGWPAARSSR